jgi:hypothetical protein
MRALAVIKNYNDLHTALRERVKQLGTTYECIDDLSGLPQRYANKVLSPSQMKGLGRLSLGCMLGATGVKLIMVEDKEALARIRTRLVPRKLALPLPGQPKKRYPSKSRAGRTRGFDEIALAVRT